MSLAARILMQRGALSIDAALSVDRGETLALVGPNGAGKTGVARALAGLDRIASGTIELDGRPLDDPASGVFVPPPQRQVGLMFQDRLLFPHLTVLDNVAFGVRAPSRREARNQARAWLKRVGLDDHAETRPSALSGGQAALVALVRALAATPRLVILDEPFAALDAETKAATRRLVRDHLSAHDGPALLVTHDPLDAFTLASRIAVLERGRVAQEGTPEEICARPASRFVAELVGMNWFRGVTDAHGIAAGGAHLEAAHELGAGVDAIAVISPRAVALHPAPPGGSPRNVFALRVADVVHAGEVARVRLEGDVALVAEVTPRAVAALALRPGAVVYAAVKATEVSVSRA